MTPDLKKEQKASSQRPRYPYSFAAKVFFLSIDLIAGKTIKLPKVKLLEILASIPYRAWETRQYTRMTRCYRDRGLVRDSRKIMEFARAAQDNEYWHLLVVSEKMKEEGIRDTWYLSRPITLLIVGFYAALMHVMALASIRSAFLFNAQFEDHAEHVYARFVEEHPEWEQQPVNNERVKERGALPTWADVFRRLCLDERDHMNRSFVFCGKPEQTVKYDGMPEEPKVAELLKK